MSLTLRIQKSNRAPRRFHVTSEQRETEEQYRYYRRAPTIKFDHQQQSSSKQSSSKQSSSKQSKNHFAVLSGSSDMPEKREEYPRLGGTKTKNQSLQGAWAKKSTIKEVPATIAEPPKRPEKQKKQKKTTYKELAIALEAAEKLVETIDEWELE